MNKVGNTIAVKKRSVPFQSL